MQVTTTKKKKKKTTTQNEPLEKQQLRTNKPKQKEKK